MSDRRQDEQLLARLAHLNPATAEQLEGSERSSAAIRGLRDIIATRRRPPWWKRRRVLIPLALAVAAAGSAAGYTLSRPVTNAATVGCYQRPTLDSPVHLVAINGSPTETCAKLLASGRFGPPQRGPLVECVRDSGVPVVLPTKNAAICVELGFTNPAQTAIAQSLTKLPQILSASVARTSCLLPARALAVAHATLSRMGLADWKVETEGHFSVAQPCSGFYVDSPRHVIMLIPELRR